jgi:hypothetical protein
MTPASGTVWLWQRIIGRCRCNSERGSVVIWVAVTTPALLLTVLLIVDGSAKLAAAERADTYAAEAARAAVIAIGPRPAGGAVDTQAAVAAADAYLATDGSTGSVTVTGPGTVTVTVHVTVIGPISGVAFTATRSATAQLLIGVSTGQAP